MAIKSKTGYLKIVMQYRVIASGNTLVSEHKNYAKADKARDAYNKKHPNQPAMVVKI